MIDLDPYRQASFRGVSFHVARAGLRFNHRVDVKEYPFQNEGMITDMGLGDDRFELAIFVIGDDFISRRLELEKVLRETGPGQLVHPTRGEFQAQVETVRHDEDYKELGVADFTVTFIRYSNQASPVARIDTQAAVITASTAAREAATESFLLQVPENPGVMASIEADLVTVTDALHRASHMIDGASPAKVLSGIDAVQNLRTSLKTVTGTARAAWTLANTVLKVTDQWVTLATDPAARLDFVMGILGLNGIRDLIDRGLYKSATGITPFRAGYSSATSRRTATSQANRKAIVELFDTGLALSGVQLSGHMAFESLPQALAVRDTLSRQLDAIAVSERQGVSPLAVNRFRSGIRSLRTAVYRDLTVRASQLPAMQSHTPDAVQPARVLSYRLTRGRDSQTAIAARNGIPHPSFVPSATPLFFQKPQKPQNPQAGRHG